ncbi:MAG: VWA domain-containing protein [Chelatococcus sp.]|uniref:vWA domain-containing protein n=1 Tax=Chelatococcus sp. TaxID=1953771 RepID=UPI0025C54C82|nr:VWA domain-containing protein [Chelatococcus sp.]MBX3536055.1 VWA domain-containing protein [Chelatococcus sp.]
MARVDDRDGRDKPGHDEERGAEHSAHGGHLADNIAYFARALRTAGLPVGPGAVIDAIGAVEAAHVGTREDFYWTLHAIFVKKHEQTVIFDQAFRLFWRRRALVEKLIAALSPIAPGDEKSEDKPKPGAERVASAFPTGTREPPRPKRELELSAQFTMSDRERLASRDFAQMSAAEIAETKQLIARLVLPQDKVATRRWRADHRGRRIDARASFRRALATGGHFVDLAWRQRDERHPPIVALVDISGSMADYSRLFLQFLHALGERRPVSSFVFGTRLTNITRALARRDPDEALASASLLVKDWEGGTRVAASLAQFNRQWSRRVLAQGAIVLMFTDGLEREVTPELGAAMDRLHRSCRRLIWLNPLLRYDGFQAKAGGIRAMLPHVDEFRTMHNLNAMTGLVQALSARGGAADPRRWLLPAA